MVDEIYDRGYQAGRAELHAGIDRLLAKVRGVMVALSAAHRLNWDAPWNAKSNGKAKA